MPEKKKPLLCRIGFHYPWHEHTVYVPVFHKVVHPNGATLPYYDRVCLRCDHEDK